jgi:hypothetical protein
MSAFVYPSKSYKLLLISLFILLLPAVVSAQYLFLQKIEICGDAGYCMDCGEPKANCDQFTLDQVADRINRKYNLKDGSGAISFQVLVEPSGFSCVLSHNDATNSPLTADLIRFLNGCIWSPAKENGKRVASSVNVIFRIANGYISGQMQRLDLTEQQPPGDPVIYNTQTVYANPSLKNYDFKTWTKYNSPLPDNISQSCALDTSDVLWYGSAKGITRFDGITFNPVNEYNSPFPPEIAIREITIDKNNDKWVCIDNIIYKNTIAGWQIYDFKKFLSAGVNSVLTARSGELLFTTKSGLVVVRKDKVVVINRKNIRELPSNNVYFAYVDRQKRIWIGTAKGTIMIDKDQFVTPFNTTNTPLKNVCISGAQEDEKGNLYFSLLDGNKTNNADNDKEGLAVLKTNGTWLHYNDKNSGMPSNHISTMLYDKFEHVLWMGTDQSGMVRFNLNDGWENYHNNNSPSPGFAISQMVQDSKGVIWVTTANGLLRIRKK